MLQLLLAVAAAIAYVVLIVVGVRIARGRAWREGTELTGASRPRRGARLAAPRLVGIAACAAAVVFLLLIARWRRRG